MSDWSLQTILARLHDGVEHRLAIAREALAHAPTKGDASARVWLDLLRTYLPARYRVEPGHVVDSNNAFSDQIDVIIFDRQYSPLVFTMEDQLIVPAESVYAVFEAKQTLNAALVRYAQDKCASVRKLHRTSLPVPHVAGVSDPKKPMPIIGGVLTLESDWKPPLGEPLQKALAGDERARLDIGCVAAHGIFLQEKDKVAIKSGGKPTTAFLLELIARLQEMGTVPMLDVRAYARWLDQ